MAIPTILSGAAGRALNTLRPLEKNTKALDALVIVNRATPDLKAALGSEAGQRVGKALFDASRRGGTASSAASREQVRLALGELETVAASTARKRIVIGSLLGGGTIAGILALRRGDEDSTPMAPGPVRAPGAPDLPSTGTYA